MALNYEYITRQARVDQLLPELMALKIAGYDLETDGLHARDNKVLLMQIGNEEKQYVIDTRYCNVEPLRPYIESREHRKVGTNLKFDYKMGRGSFGIELEEVRDIYLAERILFNGLRFRGWSFAAIVKRTLGIDVDKSMQKTFIGHVGEFSREQLDYSAIDIQHLIPAYRIQSNELRRDGLDRTFILECEALPAFGDMEFEGMLLDQDLWKKTMSENKESMRLARELLDETAKPYWGEDLFGNVDINYDSPPQVLKLLQAMKIKVKTRDKSGKEILVQISDTSKASQKQVRDLPIIQHLGKFRKFSKLINMYGQPYLDAVHPVTGRIHPDLGQIDTGSGRPASGDSEVNPLNIPRDPRYRHAFIAAPDWVIETDDYNGCELRILAEASQDPRLLDAFRRGEDVHCYVASLLYGVSVTKDKTNPNRHLRTPAKALNFGWRRPHSRNKTYSIQGNPSGAILSESAGNIRSVQRLTVQTERLQPGYAFA